MGTYLVYYLLGIIMIPGIIIAIYAQSKINRAYSAYSRVTTMKGKTAKEVARTILDNAGLEDVKIIEVRGNLTDYYNPKKKVLALSDSVRNSTSIAAVGVAAHECGHAIQHQKKYGFLKFREMIGTAFSIGSTVLWPLIIIGFILNFAYFGGVLGDILLYIGVTYFGLNLIFSLVTLPVEKDASKRALNILVDTGELDSTEVLGAKAVLNAASFTYVAAIIMSVLSLLRFVLAIFLTSRRD